VAVGSWFKAHRYACHCVDKQNYSDIIAALVVVIINEVVTLIIRFIIKLQKLIIFTESSN